MEVIEFADGGEDGFLTFQFSGKTPPQNKPAAHKTILAILQ